VNPSSLPQKQSASATRDFSENPEPEPNILDPKSNTEELLIMPQSDGNNVQAIRADTANLLLSSDEFIDVVRSLEHKTAADTTLSELNEVYRSGIVQQLKEANVLATLNEFACGIRLCIGEIDIEEGQGDAWRSWLKALTDNSKTPVQFIIPYETLDAAGNIQYRFVFSIDPKVSGY
jgi:hypothetical protein